MVNTDWKREVERIAGALSDADRADFPALARALHRALCAAPPEIVASLGMPCTRQRIDALLGSDATREAAIELLGRAPYMASRNALGGVTATVVADSLFPETRFDSMHEATAVAGALATGLADWARAAAILSPSPATH